MPEPRGPVVQAIVDLVDVVFGQRNYEDVRARLDTLDLTGCDPELHILLLSAWAHAALGSNSHVRAESVDEVRALTRRAASLVSERTSPEIRSEVLTLNAYTCNVRGDLARREELLDDARRVIPKSRPRYASALLNCLWNYAMGGRLVEHQAELAELRRHSQWGDLLQLFGLVDAVETGRLDEAVRLNMELGNPWDPRWASGLLAVHRGTFGWLKAAIGFMRGDSSPEGACRALGFAAPASSNYAGPELRPEKLPVWVWVWHHLLQRRPDQALKKAVEEVAEWGPTYDTSLGSMTLNLARCELACGHAEAARQSMERRRRLGNIRHLDDLFLARLALLTGDREAAARHFADVTALCERYQARGRLNFELQMACELAPGDLVWLGEAAAAGAGRRVSGPVRAAASSRTSEARGLERLIGASRALVAVREAVLRLGPLDVPVLITGETGTGKELVARAIHEVGPRAAEPFLAVNCGAITESLLESELFGHEKGAFTGAQTKHRGLFEEAGAGSLLLDEIGDIPPRLQVALLRVLETGEIRPVGASRPRRIACRILAATHADLAALAGQGRFRPDLLYRLQRLQAHLPPLRERPDDILPLAEHFLATGRHDGLRPVLAADVQRWLRAQQWPGNVRELRNVIERLRLLNSDRLDYGMGDMQTCELATGTTPAPSAAGAPSVPADGDERPAAGRSEPKAPAAPEDHAAGIFSASRSPMRRLDRLRALFAQHGKLTRSEVMGLLAISHATATRDLRALCGEGAVEKVMPSGSPRTHYFRLKSGAAGDLPS
jgi:DNA-binding NtrC family response regulator